MQIKELECDVGLPLFDRGGRQIALTTPGEYFLSHARRMLAALKDAEDTMARLKGVESGTADHRHGQHGEVFRAAAAGRIPARTPRRRSATRGWQPAGAGGLNLQANEVDLAIMGPPPRELDTRAEPFALNPLVMIAAPDIR